MNESRNPYQPPEAPLRSSTQEPGSPFKAVLLGLAADIGGTFICSIVIGIVYGILFGFPQSSGGDNPFAGGEFSGVEVVSWVVGASCSVFGGFVCARIARRRELQLGAVVAAGSTLFGFAFGADNYSLGVNLALFVATIFAVMLGAWLGANLNRRGA